MEIRLFKKDGEDLEDEFLQDKIKRWIDKGLPVTNRLFTLRVSQTVYPIDANEETVRERFEVREDSIIFEIFD